MTIGPSLLPDAYRQPLPIGVLPALEGAEDLRVARLAGDSKRVELPHLEATPVFPLSSRLARDQDLGAAGNPAGKLRVSRLRRGRGGRQYCDGPAVRGLAEYPQLAPRFHGLDGERKGGAFAIH